MEEKSRFDIIEWIGRKKSRWLLHVLFWLAVLLFYTFFFGYKIVDYKITFSFVIILLPVTMITTYFLNYTLLPNYLFKKKYGKFFLYFAYTLIVSFYIEMVTVMAIFVLVAELNMKELHPSNTNALILIAGMYLVVFLGAAIKLLNHYNQNQAQIQSLQREKVEAELKFLKSQLHPHFLFNTLNNLYSLTLEKSEKASGVVLKLSELLDYTLYKCNGKYVLLSDEIEQINNYIELEKLRYGDRLVVDSTIIHIPKNTKIPPMAFITLLENSFKHGVSKTMNSSWIKIQLEVNEKFIDFRIENSIHVGDKKNMRSGSGIGLDNLENRLKLMCKGDFKIKITREPSTFGVHLQLRNHFIS